MKAYVQLFYRKRFFPFAYSMERFPSLCPQPEETFGRKQIPHWCQTLQRIIPHMRTKEGWKRAKKSLHFPDGIQEGGKETFNQSLLKFRSVMQGFVKSRHCNFMPGCADMTVAVTVFFRVQ